MSSLARGTIQLKVVPQSEPSVVFSIQIMRMRAEMHQLQTASLLLLKQQICADDEIIRCCWAETQAAGRFVQKNRF